MLNSNRPCSRPGEEPGPQGLSARGSEGRRWGVLSVLGDAQVLPGHAPDRQGLAMPAGEDVR